MSVGLHLFRLSGLERFLGRWVEYASGIDQASVRVQLETKAGKIERLDVEVSLGRNGLVGEAALC